MSAHVDDAECLADDSLFRMQASIALFSLTLSQRALTKCRLCFIHVLAVAKILARHIRRTSFLAILRVSLSLAHGHTQAEMALLF